MKQLLRFLPCLILSLYMLPVNAQDWQWARKAGKSYEEQSRSVSTDAAGNSYTAGFFIDETDFGTGTILSAGGADIFLTKYNPAGVLQWVRRAGSVDDDYAYDIKADAAGNVYVIGHFQGTATFGTLSVTSTGVYDVYVAKYNTSGTVQWVQRFGGTTSDYGYSIALDPNGNIFITGSFQGTSTFGTQVLTSAGGTDVYVAKLDPAGVVLWARRGGGVINDTSNEVETDAAGNCVITGSFWSAASFDALSVTSGGNADIFVAKYNSTGDIQWVQRAGSIREDVGNGVFTDAQGNIYVAGFFQETATFGTQTVVSAGFFDIFIAKYSPAGVLQWVQRAGGAQYDTSWDIFVDANGYSFISGYFQSTASFGSLSVTSAGGNDIYMAKYDPQGNAIWVRRAGGAQFDNSFGIAATPAGEVFVTGVFSTTATFGTLPSLTSLGSYDVFLAKFNSCPVVVANAGADVTVCSGQPATIGSAPLTGQTYSWSVSPAIAGFSSDLSQLTIAAPAVTSTTNYTFTVDAIALGCHVTDQVVVTVLPLPAVAVAPASAALCQGDSVQLIATGADSYAWSPNTQISATTGSTVMVTPLASTTYQVIGTSAATGCASAPVQVPVTVTPLPAATTASNSGPICAGATLSLFAAAVPGVSYSWTGPGGFTSALQNPTRPAATAAMSGVYSVFTVAGNCAALATTTAVVNLTPSQPAITTSTPVCSGYTLTLSASTNVATSYSWLGPAGFTSSSQFPSISNITSANSGVYSVYALNGNCVSPLRTQSVTVAASPVAPVASNNGPVCAGAPLQLFASTVAGAQYSWIGPNYNSSIQNPTFASATAAMTGTYTAYSRVGSCLSAPALTQVVVNPVPAAPAVVSNTPVCAGSTLALSATSTTANITYSWVGPGGFASLAQYPEVQNVASVNAGTYTAYAISVDNSCVSARTTHAVTVSVTPAAPVATTNSPVCSGATITLQSSAVAGAIYSWLGPDTFTSTLQNPTRANATTAMAGTYSLFTRIGNCSSAVVTTVVEVRPPTPQATGSYTTPVCTGTTLQLSATSTANVNYSWSGPAGFSSLSQNPSIPMVTSANAGMYTVYGVSPDNGCPSAPHIFTVFITTSPAPPVATNNGPICAGSTLQLNATAAAGNLYTWTGPGSYFSTTQNPTRPAATVAMSGAYSVTVKSGICTSAPAITNVVVNPIPVAPVLSSNSPVCVGNTLQLSAEPVAGGSYSWTGPAGFVSLVQEPEINGVTTAAAGTYSGYVTVNGCTSPVATVTVVVNDQTAAPVAGIAGAACLGSPIQLTAATIGGVSYSWSGPAGFTSGLQNPQVPSATAANSGIYTVFSTIGGCATQTDTITINVNPLPQAAVASNNGPVCAGSPLLLNATTIPDVIYSWTGPNGYDVTGQNPQILNVTTAMAGTYTVVTVAATGCASLPATTEVVVNGVSGMPMVFSNAPICAGSSLHLSASSDPGATYSWAGPLGFDASTQTVTIPVTTVAMSGQYSVFASANGCTSPAGVITVEVNPMPVVTASATNPVLCPGSFTTLSATGAATYTWTQANGLINTIGQAVDATPTATTTYTVTGVTNGCSATATVQVTVNPAPVVTITAGTDTLTAGATTQLQAQVSGPGTFTYAWSPAAGLSSTSIANPVATPSATGAYTLTVTNQATGCTSTATITLVVITGTGPWLSAQGLNLQVVPNPTAGDFTALITAMAEQEVVLTLTDVVGRTIETRRVQAVPGQTGIAYNLNHLSDGMYLLVMQAGDKLLRVRVIKEK